MVTNIALYLVPWFGKGGFMRMCTTTHPLLMHIRIDAMIVAAAVLTASNCKVFSLTTLVQRGFQWKPCMETPLDPPLSGHSYILLRPSTVTFLTASVIFTLPSSPVIVDYQ